MGSSVHRFHGVSGLRVQDLEVVPLRALGVGSSVPVVIVIDDTILYHPRTLKLVML